MQKMLLRGLVVLGLMNVGAVSCADESGDGGGESMGADMGGQAGTGSDGTSPTGTDPNNDTGSNTDGGDNPGTGTEPGTGATGDLVQYTPDQADWEVFATKPFEVSSNTSHDPDGVGWISAEGWAEAEWDGTVYNPSQMSKDELIEALCPGVDRLRGIREVFYEHKPFADNDNPTKAEVDEWHRIAINHLRALVGYTSEDRKVKKDHCMFARAQWGHERKKTTMWDEKYPGPGGAAGPCGEDSNPHCGASFIPDLEDQAPYLPEGHEGCKKTQGAEGTFNAPKSNIPWSLKWSRAFCNTLHSEGFWGGHIGPFLHREKFGFAFWDDSGPDKNNAPANLRAKWTGKLMPNLYCNPAKDDDCDPSTAGP